MLFLISFFIHSYSIRLWCFFLVILYCFHYLDYSCLLSLLWFFLYLLLPSFLLIILSRCRSYFIYIFCLFLSLSFAFVQFLHFLPFLVLSSIYICCFAFRCLSYLCIILHLYSPLPCFRFLCFYFLFIAELWALKSARFLNLFFLLIYFMFYELPSKSFEYNDFFWERE